MSSLTRYYTICRNTIIITYRNTHRHYSALKLKINEIIQKNKTENGNGKTYTLFIQTFRISNNFFN
jgi:hypothetical protein